MNSVWTFITTHTTSESLVAFWIFSAAVSNMPAPTPESSTFYKWFFGFINAIFANLDLVAKAKGIAAPPAAPPASKP